MFLLSDFRKFFVSTDTIAQGRSLNERSSGSGLKQGLPIRRFPIAARVSLRKRRSASVAVSVMGLAMLRINWRFASNGNFSLLG